MRKKITDRPMVIIFLGYTCFLWCVICLFPSFGDRLFGWSRRENLVREWAEGFEKGTVPITGRIQSVQETTYGFRWTLKVEKDVTMQYSTVQNGGVFPISKALVTVYTDHREDVGAVVRIIGKVTFPEEATNPGQWDEKRYAREQGIIFKIRPSEITLLQAADHSVFSLFACTRDAVIKKIEDTFQEPYAGILCAMLTGEKGLLDQEEKELLQKGGISHVIAISGMHLSILAEWLSALLSLWLPKRKAQPLTAGLLWVYAFWTGGAVATLRAALMFSVKTLAPVVGREYDHISCFCFAATILLLLDPLRIQSGSFYLSFGALLGMTVGKGIIMNLPLIPYILKRWISNSLGVTMITLPISLWFFYESSLSGVWLNLWVLPTVPLVLISGVLSLVLQVGPWSGLLRGGERGFVLVTEWLLKSYETLSRLFGSSTIGAFRGRPAFLWMMAFIGMMLLIYGLLSGKGRKDGKVLRSWIIGLILTGTIVIFPYRENKVTFLDVGQGDCTVIEWQGKCILIDAGPSYDKVIKPFLMYEGISTIDLMVISHPDQDHMAGAILLSKDPDFRIKAAAFSQSPLQDTEERRTLIENLYESRILYLEQGDEISLGRSLTFKVLFSMEEAEDMNDTSLVMMADLDGGHILFPGDVAFPAEERLLLESADWSEQQRRWLHADILKAGHHGSATSTSEAFLQLAEPSVAVISCGRNNRYGHPAKETLRRLEEKDITILATPVSGCIQLIYQFVPWREKVLPSSSWNYLLCYKD